MKKDVTTPLVVDMVVRGEDDQVLASTSCERWFLSPDVLRVPVRHGRLRGTLFIPKDRGPFPGVVDLYGTAGGLVEYRAALLASKGFVTFALAYFAYDDLPRAIDLDMEYFEVNQGGLLDRRL
jgi:dienelactone hydrolase